MTQRTQKLPRIVCLEFYLFLVLLDYKYFKVASGSLSNTHLLSSLVHLGSGTHMTRVLACVSITNSCSHYKAASTCRVSQTQEALLKGRAGALAFGCRESSGSVLYCPAMSH